MNEQRKPIAQILQLTADFQATRLNDGPKSIFEVSVNADSFQQGDENSVISSRSFNFDTEIVKSEVYRRALATRPLLRSRLPLESRQYSSNAELRGDGSLLTGYQNDIFREGNINLLPEPVRKFLYPDSEFRLLQVMKYRRPTSSLQQRRLIKVSVLVIRSPRPCIAIFSRALLRMARDTWDLESVVGAHDARICTILAKIKSCAVS